MTRYGKSGNSIFTGPKSDIGRIRNGSDEEIGYKQESRR